MLVCHCKVVSDRTIRATVRAGARDLAAVARTCGAGSACGGCVPGIEELLTQAAAAIREPELVGTRQAAHRLALRDEPSAAGDPSRTRHLDVAAVA